MYRPNKHPPDAHFSPEEVEQLKLRKAPAFVPDLRCGDCGDPMILRAGPYGRFYGCVRFPKCRGTLNAALDGAPIGAPSDRATRRSRHRLITAQELLGLGNWIPEDLSQEECEQRLRAHLKEMSVKDRRSVRRALERIPVMACRQTKWQLLMADQDII